MKEITLVIQISTVLTVTAFLGVMFAIYTSHLPLWKALKPEEFLNWFSLSANGIRNATGPLGMFSLVFPLITLILTWSNTNSRLYWLFSFLLIAAVITITMIYFAKTNTAFGNKTISLDAIQSTLITWGNLHLVRLVLATISAVFSVLGIVKYYSA